MRIRWRVIWRLLLVILVMGSAVVAVVYFQEPDRFRDLTRSEEVETSPCEEAKTKIFDQSYTPIAVDAVRILSIETLEEVREGVASRQDSFRCVGIVVTNEGLSWIIFDQTRHVGTDMTSWGYSLTRTRPE